MVVVDTMRYKNKSSFFLGWAQEGRATQKPTSGF